MTLFSKVGLGTVQWGMSYGIANRSGQPGAVEVRKMLRLAREHGVTLLDTAHAYGDAENVLGEQAVTAQGFRVVTKTRPIRSREVTEQDVADVTAAFSGSLERLQCAGTYGLLVHNADTLLAPGGERLWAALQASKSQGWVEKIGVSVYRPEQLENILARYQIDLVQLPFNVYDQRFGQTGLLQRLQQNNIEVHARSAFLQGLLLLSPDQLPSHFGTIRENQVQLHQLFSESGLTPLQGCLQFCLGQTDIDVVIVGCETATQLAQTLEAADHFPEEALSATLTGFGLTNEAVINPSTWA